MFVRSRWLAPLALVAGVAGTGCADLDDPAAGSGDGDAVTTADLQANADAEAAGPIAQSGAFRAFRNVGNNLCLQPASASMADVPIVQQTCNGSAEQSWFPLHLSGNDYNFMNQLSGKCMYLDVNKPFNGAPIVQAECNGVTNELWRSSSLLPQVVAVTSRVGNQFTNFCIDVAGGAATPGLAMEVFTCNGSLAQRWVIGF